MSDRTALEILCVILMVLGGYIGYHAGKHSADRYYAAHETHGWLVYKGGKLDRIAPLSPIDINANEDWKALTIPAPHECCSVISYTEHADTPAPAGIGKPQAPANKHLVQSTFSAQPSINCKEDCDGVVYYKPTSAAIVVCESVKGCSIEISAGTSKFNARHEEHIPDGFIPLDAHPLKLGKRKASEPPSESGYCVEGLAGVPTPQVPQ